MVGGEVHIEKVNGQVRLYVNDEEFYLAKLSLNKLREIANNADLVVIVYPSGRIVYVDKNELSALLESIEDSS